MLYLEDSLFSSSRNLSGDTQETSTYFSNDPKNLKRSLYRGTTGILQRTMYEDWPKLNVSLDRNAPLIRNAKASDAEDLEALAKSVSLKHLRSQYTVDIEKVGFLVSEFTKNQYLNFIETAEHFLVLHEGSKLVGFVLAYSSEKIDPTKEETNMFIKDNLCDKFVLIKQVCVSSVCRGKGYGKLLYRELFARIIHFYGGDDGTRRPLYTVIVKRPLNQVSIDFHESTGFTETDKYTPSNDSDSAPRLIYKNENVKKYLFQIENIPGERSEDYPFYDARLMTDPNCIGVGISLYHIEPPDTSDSFKAKIRIMMKWRQPGIEGTYNREQNDPCERIEIKMKDQDERRNLRLPRFAINDIDVETVQKYAYINKSDPPDVITSQHVIKGTFKGSFSNLSEFPTDIQQLNFRFRMWDNASDDRCRYFRQLYYVDNTAWQKCIKEDITSTKCTFLANTAKLCICKLAKTSVYKVSIPCARNIPYYLLRIALPIVFISSLNIASIPMNDYDAQVTHNSTIFAITVAFLFLVKDEGPKSRYVTKLDLVIWGSFFSSWCLILLYFFREKYRLSKELIENISIGTWSVMTSFNALMLIYMYVRHRSDVKSRCNLGEF